MRRARALAMRAASAAACLSSWAARVLAQVPEPNTTSGGDGFRSRSWCADSSTACWTPGDRRQYLNGVRIVADLDVGFLFQRGNRFETSLKTLPKISLEFNLYGGWVAAQVGLIGPGRVTFDESSRDAIAALRSERQVVRQVGYDVGYLYGLSFLDGALAVGRGALRYDRRDFVPPDSLPLRLRGTGHLYSDSYWYAALQPISGIRSSFKRSKSD